MTGVGMSLEFRLGAEGWILNGVEIGLKLVNLELLVVVLFLAARFCCLILFFLSIMTVKKDKDFFHIIKKIEKNESFENALSFTFAILVFITSQT